MQEFTRASVYVCHVGECVHKWTYIVDVKVRPREVFNNDYVFGNFAAKSVDPWIVSPAKAVDKLDVDVGRIVCAVNEPKGSVGMHPDKRTANWFCNNIILH